MNLPPPIKTSFSASLRRHARFLSREEEAELTAKAHAGDVQAFQTLVLSVMPLALRVATRFDRTTQGREDLFQISALAVSRAVQKFDPSKGRLTTYSVWWVRQFCRREQQIWRQDSIVRHPTDWKRPNAVCESLARLLDQSRLHTGAVDRGEGTTFLIDLGQPYPETDAAARENRDRLHAALDQMPERLRAILLMRMECRTLRDIGRELGITGERVRQLTMSACKALLKQLGAPPSLLPECIASLTPETRGPYGDRKHDTVSA